MSRAPARTHTPVVWAISADRPLVVVRSTGELDPLWTPSEVAEYLGLTPARLDRETAAGHLSPLPLPGMPKRYPLSEVSRYQCHRKGDRP